MERGKRKIIVISFLLALGLILPSFSFCQTQAENLAEPEKMDLTEILEKTWQAFPGSLKKIWQEEILPILEKFYKWVKINIWLPIKSWLNKMVNLKAKEELNSLWVRFKRLIK